MNNTINTPKLLFRDGTSQQNREMEALKPDYVPVEGRSMEELIAEVQRLAQEIQFFNTNNQPENTWEYFLVEDPEAYQKASPEQKKGLREQWALQLASFVDNPESFISDKKKFARLSQPHTVLFITFLKLLNHVKSKINGLTQKHLNFYFQERLGLTPKEAVPDVVNVLLELTENIDKLEIKKGTIFLAGKDKDGNELHYKTNEDSVISKAKIAQLKNVFVDKQLITVKTAQLINRDTPDKGLLRMMQIALGDRNPGDELPAFPEGIDNLMALHEALSSQDNTAVISYIEKHLFLSEENFRFIMQKHKDDKQGIPTEWEEVYTILDEAYKRKFKFNRKQELKNLHENNGFEELMKHTFGNPNPGNSLPPYRGTTASLTRIFEDLGNENASTKREALDYLEDELKLSDLDFMHIIQTPNNTDATDSDWEKFYRILELANRQVRSLALPAPYLEKINDVFAQHDAKETSFSLYGDEEESKRFKTFGGRRPGQNQSLQPANLGFAISSPTLLLREGKRYIRVLIDSAIKDEEVNSFKTIFEDTDKNPIQVHLSNKDEWWKPENVTFEIGDYNGSETEGHCYFSFDEETLTISNTDDIVQSDEGKFIVFSNGLIYKIDQFISPDEIKVIQVGNTYNRYETSQKFAPDQIYLNSLKVSIELNEDDLPIETFEKANNYQFINSDEPSIAFTLNHYSKNESGKEGYESYYQSLMDLGLKKVHLSVGVNGMKNNILQNDQGRLDARKPFDPFGYEPETGSNFYFTNEEIAKKKLFSLYLNCDWIKFPEDLDNHYENYWLIEADDPELSKGSYTIQSQTDIRALGFLHDGNAEIPLTKAAGPYSSDLRLFPFGGNIGFYSSGGLSGIYAMMQETAPSYQYNQAPNAKTDGNEVVDWDRYFRLELGDIDFQHDVYNNLFATQALSEKPEIKKLKINPPYQPKIKNFSIDYSAYTNVVLDGNKNQNHDQVFHIHPFGFEQINTAADNLRLLPTYDNQGILYVGIEQLETPQILSILFQMAEGSANPDVQKPNLQWSYLHKNTWKTLPLINIISDTTNGLLNSGIVKVHIPEEASSGSAILPESMHWLMVSASNNIEGISDTIEIKAQAISATLSNATIALSHFENPLKPASITETQETIPEIKSIEQPFTSSKGKPAELGDNFYTRLSERLRHKNRALNIWDYEHMILEKFPQVYKVKCLPSIKEPGKVDLVVIPDIRNSLPFNPFAPKLGTEILSQIKEYLDAHSPSFAEIEVHNPFYLQVLSRCVVKFFPGYDVNLYKTRLIGEIKRFLSPWAYHADSDISIGNSLHTSALINFIAERPYVDYVAKLKLFQSEDGINFTDVRVLNNGKTAVIPSREDMVMVSAQTHVIDMVDENGYNEDNFEGLNYMQIQLDFEVREDL